MKKQVNKKFLKEIFETNTQYSEWYGYYNYDVMSYDGKKMLCNRASFDSRQIKDDDTIELGYYDIDSGIWHHIDNTSSFNWQQGAMLQWIPGTKSKVVYNIAKDNHYKSVIFDIYSNNKYIIDYPVYCVTPDGRYSISLNYERSYWCRAYHYQPIKNPKYNVQIANDDGIFKVDLITNSVKRIVNIYDIISLESLDDFKNAKHWLEHIMINHKGDRIAFLHRYSYGNSYNTRLMICDINGNNLSIVSGWKDNDWSHFGWKGNREFVIYSVKKNIFQANYAKSVQKAKSKYSFISIINCIAHLPILKFFKDRLKPNIRYYKLYEEIDNKFIFKKNFDNKLFSIDGHPSFTDDGQYMITDSYPDNEGFQKIIVYNCISNKGIIIAKLFAPLSGNPASCDLHPKLSYYGNYLAIDTAYTGTHHMILFELKWNEIKKEIE